MSSPNPLVRPSRSAHAAIGGYLYQTCLGVLRWLDLADGEVLLCEGDEDLDRLIAHGIGTSEQVKALGDGVSIRDRVVTESLRRFLLSYVTLRQRGEERRFVFTTTARRRRQRTDDELAVDVLASWSEATRDAEKRDAVIAALRRLLPPKDDGRPATDELRRAVEDAFAWLDREEDRWTGFLGSVEWTFEAPDTGGVRGRIADRLSARPQTRALPLEDVIDRLVAELLEAATRPEPVERTRTREDLTRFFASLETELASWAATPRAARLRAMFDELGQVGKLLHDGTRELPERGFGPGKLLTAAYEVIPFDEHGRRDELDALAAWCNHERSTSVWLWTGEGGTGKSRLLIEWCRRLAAQGWHTGFLHPNRTAAELAPLLRGVVPRLVVVDYAETRLEVVKPFLREMALTRDDGPKLRLVLLARRKADWWQALGRDDESVEDLLLESPAPRELAALVGRGAAREAAFRRASTAFAEALPSELPDPLPVPDLDRDDFDRVLYLHMAALAAAGGERIGDAHDALERTLQHEHRFWQKEISGLVGGDGVAAQALEEAVEPVVAALTLVGGAGSETEARALVERVISGGARRDDVRVALPGLLRRLYGGSPERGGRHLEGLQPDLLGEELVAASLSREASLLERVIDGADAGGRSQLLTVLARLARRRPEAEEWLDGAFREHLEELAEIALAVAVESGDPVGMVLARQVESGASVELAERLMRRCDRADYLVSVPLREVAFGATRKCLEAHRSRWPEPGEEQLAERAGIANNLGSRLRDLGRREDALEATCEAVDIRRQLAASRPDAFLPDLATSLNNLGKMLS
ncbi:MAG: hypothetical protein GY856_42620, partial [bacterium]|nr:hypothetical protein [bacterium]